jgi:hypothetical protein
MECVRYLIGIETGSGARYENLVFQPSIEGLFCPGVFVAIAVISREFLPEIYADNIVWTLLVQLFLEFRCNNIVRGSKQIFP